MKQMIAACVLTVAIAASPAHASGLSDPVVAEDIIIAEAENDSGKVDSLMIAIWASLLFATLGGAF